MGRLRPDRRRHPRRRVAVRVPRRLPVQGRRAGGLRPQDRPHRPQAGEPGAGRRGAARARLRRADAPARRHGALQARAAGRHGPRPPRPAHRRGPERRGAELDALHAGRGRRRRRGQHGRPEAAGHGRVLGPGARSLVRGRGPRPGQDHGGARPRAQQGRDLGGAARRPRPPRLAAAHRRPGHDGRAPPVPPAAQPRRARATRTASTPGRRCEGSDGQSGAEPVAAAVATTRSLPSTSGSARS